MRALVCLWTDSQQWTEFFSNLLLPVSKSAATLSERKKKIQKNNKTNPPQKSQTQQGLRLSELESTRKFRQTHQRMLDSYNNQACSLKNIQPRPQDQRSTFKVTVRWKARPNKITKTKSISFKNFWKLPLKISASRPLIEDNDRKLSGSAMTPIKIQFFFTDTFICQSYSSD